MSVTDNFYWFKHSSHSFLINIWPLRDSQRQVKVTLVLQSSPFKDELNEWTLQIFSTLFEATKGPADLHNLGMNLSFLQMNCESKFKNVGKIGSKFKNVGKKVRFYSRFFTFLPTSLNLLTILPTILNLLSFWGRAKGPADLHNLE